MDIYLYPRGAPRPQRFSFLQETAISDAYLTMLEYENKKSKTPFNPRTRKVFGIKVVLFFELVIFFMVKLPFEK